MITKDEHAITLALWAMSEQLQDNPDYKKLAKVRKELESLVKTGSKRQS